MKVVILAGGLGSRLSEETSLKPKPMVKIGNFPILWHIMKIYSHFGYNDFIICCGYMGFVIKEYFINYRYHNSNLIVNLETNQVEIINKTSEKWKVSLLDTGDNSNTGGRIKKIKNLIGDDNNFFMTYGDGLADIDLNKLKKSHEKANKIATVTAVQPLGRFGSLKINKNKEVTEFKEKPLGDAQWINGGFFVLNKEIFQFIEGDATIFEQEPMKKLVQLNQLNAYSHTKFWQPMDTLREKNKLNQLWSENKAPWKIWND